MLLGAPTTIGLRLVAATGLLVSAGVHLHLAGRYDLLGDAVTQGALFRAQAVAAVLAALLLALRRPAAFVPAAFVPAVVVAAGSLAALVGTAYLRVPALGPLPALYEPIWFPAKVLAAAAAGVALLAAVAGLAAARHPGRPVRA